MSVIGISTHPALHEAASEAARYSSGDAGRAEEIEEELLGHLEGRYRGFLALGENPDQAADRAISEFGDPGRVRLHLYSRRLAADLRAAGKLTTIWKAVAFADAAALAVFVASAMPGTWLTPGGRSAFLGALAGLSLIAISGALSIVRFGVRELMLAARGAAPRAGIVTGAGLVSLAVTAWLAFVPSAGSAAIRSLLYPRMELDSALRAAVALSAVIAFGGFVAAVRSVMTDRSAHIFSGPH